ncbi:inner centromere -like [Paramuricea clavata]|uniref:Inner centromere -like n=1 Tax=Paramuricea clavata TaxID=317549 RepID=A0A7D9LAI6_PARCT|nr:inner centromere -like [Paramuricea clavata]
MASTSDHSDVGVSVGNYNKRKRSAVWDYFKKSEIEGKSKCLLCKEVVKHLSNTSNLAKHLKGKHLPEYNIYEKPKNEDEESRKKRKPQAQSVQLTLQATINKTQKYSSTCRRQKKTRRGFSGNGSD